MGCIHAVTLIRHPGSADGAVRGIDARVRRDVNGALAITYSIEGDLARVRVPPPGAPRIAHGLWQRTCCECFIALPDAPGYREFNFSPSGEWAAYAFAKYREGEALADAALDPRIAVRRGAEKLDVDAAIPLDRLSAAHAGAKLALALSVVVEDHDGMLSYWALRHPPGAPDFHHRDAFALELESP